jgi:hypothetical protein
MPRHEHYTLLNDEVWSEAQCAALNSAHNRAEFYGVPEHAKWIVDEIEACGGVVFALADHGDRDGWTTVFFDGGLECVHERNKGETDIYIWAAGEVPNLDDDP